MVKRLGAVIKPSASYIRLPGETVYDGGWRDLDPRALRQGRELG